LNSLSKAILVTGCGLTIYNRNVIICGADSLNIALTVALVIEGLKFGTIERVTARFWPRTLQQTFFLFIFQSTRLTIEFQWTFLNQSVRKPVINNLILLPVRLRQMLVLVDNAS